MRETGAPLLVDILYRANLRTMLNTLRPRQNGRRFADDTFKRIFLNENVRISIKISQKFFPKGPINTYPPLIQIMAWCQSGNKPLSEPMMVSLLTHICVTRPQWVDFMAKALTNTTILLVGHGGMSHCGVLYGSIQMLPFGGIHGRSWRATTAVELDAPCAVPSRNFNKEPCDCY